MVFSHKINKNLQKKDNKKKQNFKMLKIKQEINWILDKIQFDSLQKKA
jgi:hypothetical protein